MADSVPDFGIPDFTPVNLLTGFLGSGKTTLLRRLLTDTRLARTAVLINEFGLTGAAPVVLLVTPYAFETCAQLSVVEMSEAFDCVNGEALSSRSTHSSM